MNNRQTDADFLRDMTVDIYAGLFDLELRDSIADRLVERIGGCAAIWFAADGGAPDDTFLSYSGPDFGMEDYLSHYMHIDVWHEHTHGYQPGELMVLDEAFIRREFGHTEIFNDFVVPRLGAVQTCTGIVERHGDFSSHCSICRGPGEQSFSEAEQELLRELLPHFANWAKLRGQLEGVTRQTQLLSEALNGLGAGVFVLARDLRIVECNKAGEALLGAQDGLLSRRSHLTFEHRDTQSNFARLVAETAATVEGTGRSAGGSLWVVRPSGRTPYGVMVAPLRRHLGAMHQGYVQVIVSDPDRQPASLAALLGAAFGLTAAEAETAVHLQAGRTIAEIADLRQVSIVTARNQVRTILAKSDTGRQSEFVRLATSLTLAAGGGE